jgi:hypothetical protein
MQISSTKVFENSEGVFADGTQKTATGGNRHILTGREN